MAVLTDTDILRIVNQQDLVIYPLDTASITGVGYDLRIGSIAPLNEFDKFRISNDRIVIPPRCYCVVITREFVWLSGRLIGTLHARGTLAAKGLFTNATNVDPNFKGQMIMSVANLSGVELEIGTGDPFITLILHQTVSPTKTLVGKEGTKNSMRVTNEFTATIYCDKQRFPLENETANQLHHFLNKSYNEFSYRFEALIREAEKRGPIKFIKNLFVNNQSARGVVSRTVRGLVVSAAYAFAIFVMAQMALKLFRTGTWTPDDLRAVVLLMIAVIGLLKR